MIIKRIMHLTLLLFSGLFFSFLLIYCVEWGLTLVNPKNELPFNGFNDKGQRITWGHSVVNNSFGFRDREWEVPKSEGIYRILLLGDSLTWGAGLALNERYSFLLEEKLNVFFSHIKVEVFNLGVSGGPTIRERDILLKLKDELEPDLIVVGFCMNDPQPRSESYRIEKIQFDEQYGFLIESTSNFLRGIHLENVALKVEKFHDILVEFIGLVPPWYIGLDRVYDKNSDEWNNFVIALSEIKSISDEMKLPRPIFAVLNQGTDNAVSPDYKKPDHMMKYFLKWYHQAEETARDLGFITLNFENELQEQLGDSPIAVNILDGHPGPKANSIYAQKLFAVTKEIIKDEVGLDKH